MHNINLISHRINAFTQSEIINMVPAKVMAKIKEKDPHPFFQMYSICHEGVSSPTIIGEGPTKILWPRKAIQSIKNVIKRGIKFFKGHNNDSSHDGRKVIGRVVHAFEKDIDGVLHHVVISYHKPSVREEAKNYDICSQESVWNFANVAGQMVADTLEKITGIALENSNENSPAFSGAKRLGMVQAFETIDNAGNAKNEKQGAKRMLTLDEIKQAVKNQNIHPKDLWSFPEIKQMLNLHPSELFNLEDIKNDREFKSEFDKLEDLSKEKETLQSKIKEFEIQNQRATAKERIQNSEKYKTLTDNMKTFVLNRFEKQIDKINEFTDQALENFVETEADIYRDIAKQIDPNADINIPDSDEPKTDDEKDYSKAENNELLEEDIEI